MPSFQVGRTEIPYTVSYSARAKRPRILVNSGAVQVIAPEGTPDDEIQALLYRRRRWVFDTRARMMERMTSDSTPQGYASGSKIRYRGRMMRIRFERGTEKTLQVRYRNGFLIEVPEGLSPTEQSSQVEAALSAWLKAKLYEDASALIQQVSRQIEVKPKGLRLREQKHLWGSCGKDGIIYLNWRLIHAPRPVLEYAVVHELCHLRFRTHSNEFWMLVRSVLPDYETRKRWLDEAGELVGSRG